MSAELDVLQVLPRVEVLELGGEVRVELEVWREVLKVVIVREVIAVGLTQVWVCMGVRVCVCACMRFGMW